MRCFPIVTFHDKFETDFGNDMLMKIIAISCKYIPCM